VCAVQPCFANTWCGLVQHTDNPQLGSPAHHHRHYFNLWHTTIEPRSTYVNQEQIQICTRSLVKHNINQEQIQICTRSLVKSTDNPRGGMHVKLSNLQVISFPCSYCKYLKTCIMQNRIYKGNAEASESHLKFLKWGGGTMFCARLTTKHGGVSKVFHIGEILHRRCRLWHRVAL
jgi:hypothetical protein